jgi:hypothetical protein
MTEQEQDWYFTFGFGQLYPNCYVKFHGTFNSARDQMVEVFGVKWAFQYGSEEEAGVHRFNLKEITL